MRLAPGFSDRFGVLGLQYIEKHRDIIRRMNDFDAFLLEIGVQARQRCPRNHSADHIFGEIQLEKTEFLVHMNHCEGVPREKPLPQFGGDAETRQRIEAPLPALGAGREVVRIARRA